MEELKKINRIIDKEYPDAYRETLVVLDGTTGQNAMAQARQFMEVAQITGISNSTIRIAAASLVSEGILKKQDKNFVITTMDFDCEKLETLTLVEKIAANIRSFIQENLSEGDKLPTNIELARNFNVSVKTIHDAVKLLSKEGILHSRRCRGDPKTCGTDYAGCEERVV